MKMLPVQLHYINHQAFKFWNFGIFIFIKYIFLIIIIIPNNYIFYIIIFLKMK